MLQIQVISDKVTFALAQMATTTMQQLCDVRPPLQVEMFVFAHHHHNPCVHLDTMDKFSLVPVQQHT